MILTNYEQFRYAAVPNNLDVDKSGWPRWDPSLLSGQIALPMFVGENLFPLTVTANGGADDATIYEGRGVDEWHWYLSQRNDDAASQYLTCTQDDATKSGTVTLDVTDLAVTLKLPFSSDGYVRLVADCYLYAVKIATKEYLWGDITKAFFSINWPRS